MHGGYSGALRKSKNDDVLDHGSTTAGRLLIGLAEGWRVERDLEIATTFGTRCSTVTLMSPEG